MNFSGKQRLRDKALMLSRAAWGASVVASPLMIGAAIGLLPVAASAQNTATEQAADQSDIIVTARKRDESVLTVPIAITAFTDKDIRAAGVQSLTDIANYTPGFTLNNNAANHPDRGIQNLYIRGMSSSVSPTVTVFIDGAAVPGGFISEVSDAARVEILKGPQSAYFGRQTFAGAINIVTKTPSNDLSGSIEGLYGSDNWYDVRGSLEGALIPDILTARLSARAFSTDGQYKSTIAPFSDLGAQSTKSVTLALNFTPTDRLTVKVFGSGWIDKDGPAPVYKFGSSSFNCNGGAGPAGTNNYICGTLPGLNTTRIPVQTLISPLFVSQVFNNATGTLNPLFKDTLSQAGFKRRGFHGHVNIDYEIPGLGLTLTSLTATNIQQSENIVNLDNQDTSGIPNFYTSFGIPNIESFYQWFGRVQQKGSDFSQEFRLTSDQSSRFRYTAGVSYQYVKAQGYVDGLFPFGVASFGGGGPQINKVWGFFGGLSYDVVPEFTVTLEGRYQKDEISVYNRVIGAVDTLTAKTSSGDFLPRAIIQYKPNPTTMIYATYSKGVNPPVFNTSLVGKPAQILESFKTLYGVQIAVKPEYLQNFEIGAKGQFFDNKLQLSTAVYFNIWQNQILSQFVSVPGIPGYLNGNPVAETVQTNGGITHLYGVELDGRLEVTPELMFTFAGAYNGTEVIKYPDYRCPGAACSPNGAATNINGNALPNAPKFSANLGATYTGQLTAKLGWYGRADYIYKGPQYADLGNRTQIAGSNRFNFRLGLTMGTGSLEAFVLNAFNDRAYPTVNGTTDIDAQPNQFGAYPLADILGVPVLRQFGLRLRKTF